MEDNKLKNRTDVYDIMEDWIKNVGPKYLDMEALSVYRAGPFGYFNEIMANTQEDILNENSVLYNEMWFNRAILPQTIYANASTYNVQNINARPALMSFILYIREDELLENAINENKETYFIIDSDSEIIIEDKFKFAFDYDIKISIKKNYKKEFVYTAKYLAQNLNNPISKINGNSDPFLKLTKIDLNGLNYIIINVDAHQVEKTVVNKPIYSDEFIDYYSFDVPFTTNRNQLADFSVFYREPSATEFKQIKKLTMDQAAVDEKFCFYQMKDENTVNISFSTIVRFFKPVFNSELQFVFYTTDGKSGDFKYKGKNIRLNLKSEKYDYRRITVIIENISDSVGGDDAKTFEDIKRETAYMASTCNNIGTEIDLNKYFNSIAKTSKMLFVKKRDDILDRLYSSFLLLKDSKNDIVPSNTLNMKIYDRQFSISDENTKRFILTAGTKLSYLPSSKLITVDNKEENKDKIYFMNPFTIVVNKSPFMVNYYMPSINTNYIPSFDTINDKCLANFIVNKLSIKRNAMIGEKDYVIEFKTKCNVELKNLEDIPLVEVDKKGKFVKATGNLISKGYIFTNANSDDISYYFDFEMVDYSNEVFTFRAKISTDDFISIRNFLRITGGLKDCKDMNKTEMMIDSVLNFGFAMYLKEKEVSPHKYNDRIPNIDLYSLSTSFKINESIDLINDLNKLMYSNVTAKLDDRAKSYFSISEVPVLGYKYMKNKSNCEDFISTFFSDFKIIYENLNLLTAEFSTSIKFYNTYGKSNYFYINEVKSNTIDRVNVTLSFKIKLNPNKLNDGDLQYQIKKFIQDYVESVNDDKNLYISNLVTSMQDSFRDILFTHFKAINNYSSEIQTVEKNFPIRKLGERNKLKDFVPEFLNINKIYDGDKVENDIEIIFY